MRKFGLAGALTLALLAGLSACSLLRESPAAAQPGSTPNPAFPVVHVTADQVAQAMEEDHFFADYGYTTLLIQGTVLSARRQAGDLVISLDTSVPTKVMCNLGNYAGIVQVGSTVTVQSVYPERDASRQPSAVMIKNCSIP